MAFWKPALFPSSGKGASNLAGPLNQAVLSLGSIEMVNLLRYALENQSSPRVITGKWPLKN
jgi:hypothetical protein